MTSFTKLSKTTGSAKKEDESQDPQEGGPGRGGQQDMVRQVF